jgi:hypothetical protein
LSREFLTSYVDNEDWEGPHPHLARDEAISHFRRLRTSSTGYSALPAISSPREYHQPDAHNGRGRPSEFNGGVGAVLGQGPTADRPQRPMR